MAHSPWTAAARPPAAPAGTPPHPTAPIEQTSPTARATGARPPAQPSPRCPRCQPCRHPRARPRRAAAASGPPPLRRPRAYPRTRLRWPPRCRLRAHPRPAAAAGRPLLLPQGGEVNPPHRAAKTALRAPQAPTQPALRRPAAARAARRPRALARRAAARAPAPSCAAAAAGRPQRPRPGGSRPHALPAPLRAPPPRPATPPCHIRFTLHLFDEGASLQSAELAAAVTQLGMYAAGRHHPLANKQLLLLTTGWSRAQRRCAGVGAARRPRSLQHRAPA